MENDPRAFALRLSNLFMLRLMLEKCEDEEVREMIRLEIQRRELVAVQ